MIWQLIQWNTNGSFYCDHNVFFCIKRWLGPKAAFAFDWSRANAQASNDRSPWKYAQLSQQFLKCSEDYWRC